MITLHRVTKSYKGEAGAFDALTGVDLEIRTGEMIAVTGRSGSGKSTLLHLVGGLDRPSTGSVHVGGRAIHELGENDLARWRGRTIGFIFQFFQLMPTLTAVENVMLPMDFAGAIPPGSRRHRALDLLERFGVREQEKKLPATLSGGEQQRVAIARALANEPSVILADEPTGNLDSHTAGAVLDLFRGVADAGTTVVVATHDPNISRISDRSLSLIDGRIAPQRSSEEVAG